jgi:hypothetical protein
VPIYPPVRLDRIEEYARRHVGILRNAEARELVTFSEAAGVILKKLLVGRIVFRQRPDGRYEFSGEASLGRTLAGVVCTKAGVAPTEFERLCTVSFRGVLP